MSGSSVRMVAVAVVAVLVGGLVGCGDRSSSTLVTSLPTTTTTEEAPAEVTEPSSTTSVEPDPVQDPTTTTTTTVEPDPVQDPTTTVAEEAPAEVTEPSTTTSVVSDPVQDPSTTTSVVSDPVQDPSTTTSVVSDPVQDPSTTTSVVSDPVQDPSTTTSVVSDPVQDPSTTTTSVVSDPGPSTTTIVEPEPVSPTTTTTTTVDPGLVGVGNEFSGEPVSEVEGDETLDFVEVALPPAGWDGRLPEPVGERLPYVLHTDDEWVPPDIWPEHWDQRKQRGSWVSEVVDFRVGTVREPPPYPLSADPSAEEQTSYDNAYRIVVAIAPVLPSNVGIGSNWLIYWCHVNPWWYRQEDPETVNGYMVVLPAYKVEGGFRESIGGANVGPC